MPELSGDALALYKKAYGEERYLMYNDDDLTTHRGLSPSARGKSLDDVVDETSPSFQHRSEHDVESIYWSMVVVLLRVHPALPVHYEIDPCEASLRAWEALHSHQIPQDPSAGMSESRYLVSEATRPQWLALFLPEMHDVALLMLEISRHINSEYALWEWEEGKYREDHLHEALQRLIFKYLHEHRDNPILLNPDYLRPTRSLAERQKDAERRTAAARQAVYTAAESTTESDSESDNESEDNSDVPDLPEAGSQFRSDGKLAVSISKAAVASGSKRKALAVSGGMTHKEPSGIKRRRGASGVVLPVDGDIEEDF